MRLDLLHFLLCCGNQRLFLRRHQHVINTDRHAATGGVGETGIHQFVGKNHRLTQAATAEAGVDEFGNFLLLENLVDVRERQADRQDLRQQ